MESQILRIRDGWNRDFQELNYSPKTKLNRLGGESVSILKNIENKDRDCYKYGIFSKVEACLLLYS